MMGLLIPLAIHAQHGSTTKSNPFSSRMDILAGQALFRTRCAPCHGPAGEGGGNGPDLTKGEFRHGSSDEHLYKTVFNGVAGSTMKSSGLDGRETWQVVAYVRSLSVGRGLGKTPGDAGRGAKVFVEKQCHNCHTAGAEGGITGPDLSNAGARLSAGEIAGSILRPDESVATEYWRVEGVARDGKRVEGQRLNEDSFSYQIRDRDGRLQSVDKDDLSSHRIVRKSAMPSFEGKLQGTELDDLVAYLASLRREGAR
jgi:putative heme-binding domain-containing protein